MIFIFRLRILLKLGSLLLLLIIAACTQTGQPARMTELWQQSLHHPMVYTVQPGDTLFSIAWAYGLDYRQVALKNKIKSPNYPIQVGQKIYLSPALEKSSAKLKATPNLVPQRALVQKASGTMGQAPITSGQQPHYSTNLNIQPISTMNQLSVKASPVETPKPAISETASAQNFEPINQVPIQTLVQPLSYKTMALKKTVKSGVTWCWPSQGKILAGFAIDGLHKGIDIGGSLGQPVLAAAAGQVVYVGSGLRGYGNLVILKHNDEFLSAYAHNAKILVTEGQLVKCGQMIAEMGDTESRQVMLHFEIRKAGKPVDPLDYLPAP